MTKVEEIPYGLLQTYIDQLEARIRELESVIRDLEDQIMVWENVQNGSL